VDGPHVVQVAHMGQSDLQISPSRVVFGRSRGPEHGGACVCTKGVVGLAPNAVSFSFLVLLSLLLEFCVSSWKFSEQLLQLFFLHIWSLCF